MSEVSQSNLQRALNRATPIWGGWITGPTLLGPEEFARAGYDYVGFDAQHGYLDDADIARILRRIEHVPIGTSVRLPNADAAPIGRVLDAGADAVVIAMIESAEQAAAAVAATRYPPAGIRSFGPLRASLGHDSAALQSRVSVFAMIETAAALSGLSRDLCCRRPDRNLHRAGRSGYLDGCRCRWGDQTSRSAGRDSANPSSGYRRGAGHRHSCGRGQDGSRHGAAGISDDHPGGRIAGAAAGGGGAST